MRYAILVLLLFPFLFLAAQDPEPMRVLRVKAIDYYAGVNNIHVDAENRKWIATNEGFFLVYDLGLGEQQETDPDSLYLLNLPDGNARLAWNKADFEEATGAPLDDLNFITCAAFDERKEELWVGTSASGFFQLKLQPRLRLLASYSTANTKMRSDYVNTIFIDMRGRKWIGTTDGVFTGANEKWDLIERGFDIETIRGNGTRIWFMGDGLVGPLDRMVWYPIDVPERSTEGRLRTFTFDQNGDLWLASSIISRINLETENFTVYGPAEYFTSEYTSKIAVDLDGAVWVGTADKGMFLIEKASAMTVTALVDRELGCEPDARDASLKVSVTGGQPPYQYEWAGGLTGANPQGVGAGSYAVTVTDSNGKSRAAQVEVAGNTFELAVKALSKADAEGNANGSASVAVTGRTGFFDYRWDNGETTSTASSLSPGRHTVTVTERGGCTAVATVEVEQELPSVAGELQLVRPVSCPSGADAVVAAVIQGGQPPYAYTWSAGNSNSETLSGLAAGSYSVTVADAAGNTFSASIQVDQPEEISLTIAVLGAAGQGTPSGKAEVNARGGNGGYTFRWDNGETGATAQKLNTGMHGVTVTDNKGCISTATVDIPEKVLPMAINIAPSETIQCQGEASGAVRVVISGGKEPFTYQWSLPELEGPNPEGLKAGAYSVTVTDASGAEISGEVTLNEPSAIRLTTQVLKSASTNGEDGQASVTAEGGVGGYQYLWDNGAQEARAPYLAPGKHQITVTDKNGCTAIGEVTILENILPLMVEVEQTAGISCQGEATAALQSAVSGGKPPYQLAWSNGGSDAGLEGLAAGTYSLTVTDVAGNEQVASVTVEEPASLAAVAEMLQPAKLEEADGRARLTITGGTPDYRVSWDNGETNTLAEKLTSGAHAVTVTDAQGCSTSAEVVIGENILPLEVTIELVAPLKCFGTPGARLEVKTQGGKPPFSYQWNNPALFGARTGSLPAGNFAVTVTDALGTEVADQIEVVPPPVLEVRPRVTTPASANGIDGVAQAEATGGTPPYRYAWDTGAETERAEGLAPGTHAVTVTDANGCTAAGQVEVQENILPLTAGLEVAVSIRCFGQSEGALAVNTQGGKAPFTYQWSQAGLSGSEVTGLSAGNYTVTVTDAAGNQAVQQIELPEPAQLDAAIEILAPASANQSDGEAKVIATGGTPPYRYVWDTGAETERAEGLAPGTHAVTVTDANGCTAAGQVEVQENILPLTAGMEVAVSIRCFGQAEGALAVNTQGGKAPFTYQWSKAGLSGSEVTGLSAGSYIVTVTDAAGNQAVQQIELPEPAQLDAAIEILAPASANQSDGEAKVIATGGTPPYRYVWDTGAEMENAKGLSPGAHYVSVTDANGCLETAAVSITENILPLVVKLEETRPISCQGAADAALEVAVKGGKAPFTYRWDKEGLSGEAVSGLAPGAYRVVVTDVEGTEQAAEMVIDEPAVLALELTRLLPANGPEAPNGQATIAISGGTSPYAVLWDNGEATATAERLSIGTHAVTVTDARGCAASLETTIGKKLIPDLQVGNMAPEQIIQMEALRFESDNTSLNDGMIPILEELYDFLRFNPGVTIEIGGHTNNLPSDDYCDRLSTARAKSVADYLTGKGIPGQRVTYQGYGKRNPIASNDTPEGRMKNQRVEIKILEAGDSGQ